MGDMSKQIRVGIGVMVLREGKLLLGHRCEKGKDTAQRQKIQVNNK